MDARQRLQRIGIIALLLAGNLLIVFYAAGDLNGTEIARFRNSFLAQSASESEFEWTPANVPVDYLLERDPVSKELLAWVKPFRGQVDPINRALAIARSLSDKPRYGEPIQLSTMATFHSIVTSGTGYCVDYTKVYNALAYAAGFTTRQWAFSFDGFGGHGHMFSEVWNGESHQWMMVDVFHGFIPRDTKTGAPLSALEFRRRLTTASETIRWERITPDHFAFKNDAEALDYYQRGAGEWYLWWGNNVLGYDQNPLVAQAQRLGHLPEQLTGILTGTLPKFKVLLTQQNRAAFDQLIRLKYRLLTAAAVELLLVFMLMWQAWLLWQQRQVWQLRHLSKLPVRDEH